MSSNGLSNIFQIITSWLGTLIVPVINVSALSIWVGIFLMALGVWVLGLVFGLVQDFVHDAKADENARKRDAENERKYWNRKLENNQLEYDSYRLSKDFKDLTEWRYRWRDKLIRDRMNK